MEISSEMKKYIIIILMVALTGCLDIKMSPGDTYYRKIPDMPIEGKPSFKSQRAMSAGATLLHWIAAKIYYEGTDPKSQDGKTLLDLAYRILGTLRVNTEFNPSDPAQIKKVLSEYDDLQKEQARLKDEYERQTAKWKQQLISHEDWVRKNEKHKKGLMTTIKGILLTILFILILIFIIGKIIEHTTGVNIFKLIKLAKSGVVNLVKSIQEHRNNLNDDTDPSQGQEMLNNMSEHERASIISAVRNEELKKFDNNLAQKQKDGKMQDMIHKIKVKNGLFQQ